MDADDRRLSEERRLRKAALTATSRQPPPREDTAGRLQPSQDDSGGTAEDTERARRLKQQTRWVDLHVRMAIERGEFEHLPGAGKPIPDLDGTHDPDWWVKKLIAREQITGVLPPALQLRKEDAALDALLDQESTAQGVRRVITDFNARIIEARRQLLGGPPVITATRDVEEEIARWQQRRAERRERLRHQRTTGSETAKEDSSQRRRWWRRSSHGDDAQTRRSGAFG